MKQLPQRHRPPVLPPQKTPPPRPKAKPGAGKNGGVPLASATGRPGRKTAFLEQAEPPKPGITLQQKLLAGLALLVIVVLFVLLAIQPQGAADRRDQDNALATALAATGFTAGPTIVPGSDFGVDLVIYGIKDYIPVVPGEKVTFYINNKREKSLYVSNCDGTVLQRFNGNDVTDKTQTADLNNWINVAPGGYPSCGPVTGRQAVQIPPGANADASFPFDTKKTRPYPGEDWNIPGNYRIFIQYYLLCPSGGQTIDDCSDRHYSWSDTFKIVAPQYTTPQASVTPASPVASPTPTP
jgi:hypothetical protein